MERARNRGILLPILAVHAVNEYYRLPWKPPLTAALVAANSLIYLRPAFLRSFIPYIDQVCFNPYLILKYKDWKRFFLSPFYHVSETHMVYNMMSLLWKGIQLETTMGSAEFATMVASVLTMSQGITLLLAKSLLLLDYERPYYHEYTAGFSGVLFAMKVVLNSQSENYTNVYGLIIPPRYAAWAELILIQMLVPDASFLGHLGGILAGILYVKLKTLCSGSDPLAAIIKSITSALSSPIRFVRSLFLLRQRRITGRGTIGRRQRDRTSSGLWGCQACTYENPASTNICEMCGTGRTQSDDDHHSHNLSVEELRQRRLQRFGR